MHPAMIISLLMERGGMWFRKQRVIEQADAFERTDFSSDSLCC